MRNHRRRKEFVSNEKIKFFFKSLTTMPTKYFLCTKDVKAQKWWSQESLKHND